MIYLITALDAEARVLVDHYRLKRDTSLPYTLYRNDEIVLLVSGMGKSNAMMAVSALLGWRIPTSDDCIVNVGICGAPAAYSIGEALLIHQIIEGDRHYYPDILYTHSLHESSLLCVDTPQSDACSCPVDMESSAVFQSASRFFKLHQMAFIKIVSDHCKPENVTKEGVIELIRSNLAVINEVLAVLKNVQKTEVLFSDIECSEIEDLKSSFTKSQGDMLEDALCYFRLKHRDKPLPLIASVLNSKRERSQQLDTLIATLTA